MPPLASSRRPFRCVALAIACLLVPAFAGTAAADTPVSGGATFEPPPPPPQEATLVDGRVIAPASAPLRVKRVIAAANRLVEKPYIYGGGHGHWWDRGYDCSGSVSYALHGGNFLTSPLPSGPMEKWGLDGQGRWITVYANSGHAYAEIAGFRWDTSGDAEGTGPRWHEELRDNVGYVARHPAGF